MTPEQFAYWLQGFVEVNDAGYPHSDLKAEQWQIIKDHLKTVFHKITPTYPVTPVPFPQYPKEDDPLYGSHKIIC